MVRSFDTLDQLGDGIEVDAGAEAEIRALHPEPARRGGTSGLEADPQCIVDDRPEGPSRRSCGLMQPGGDVVIQRQSGSMWHIMKPDR
jgi:hypothetical protein